MLVGLGVPDLISVKELVHLLSSIQHAEGRHPGETSDVVEKDNSRPAPKHVDNTRELVILASAREQWQAEEELDGNTAQGPDVDGSGVGHS